MHHVALKLETLETQIRLSLTLKMTVSRVHLSLKGLFPCLFEF